MTQVLKKWRRTFSKSIFYDSQKMDWFKKALNQTLLVLVFTILPTIMGILIAFLMNQGKKYLGNWHFDGQILIYAISLMVSSYTILHFHKRTPSMWWIVVLIGFVAAYSVNSVQLLNDDQINHRLLLWLSIIGFILGVILCYRAQYIQQKNIPPDIRKGRDADVKDLMNNLEI